MTAIYRRHFSFFDIRISHAIRIAQNYCKKLEIMPIAKISNLW